MNLDFKQPIIASFAEFRLLSEVRVIIHNSVSTVELNDRQTFGNREGFHTSPLYAYLGINNVVGLQLGILQYCRTLRSCENDYKYFSNFTGDIE